MAYPPGTELRASTRFGDGGDGRSARARPFPRSAHAASSPTASGRAPARPCTGTYRYVSLRSGTSCGPKSGPVERR